MKILLLALITFASSEKPSTSTVIPTTSTATTSQVTTVSTAPAATEHANDYKLSARANAGLTTRAVSYPDCADPTTYRNYNKATQYKTLGNTIAWDWGNTQSCNLTQILLPPEPVTCGDCDFELTGGAWYRFPVGSLGQIVGFPDGESCPEVGHCNGYGQISLVPSNMKPGHPSAKYFGILISNNPNISEKPCFVGDLEDPSQMVQAFHCLQFTLYQFPKLSWESLDPSVLCRLTVNGTTVPAPSSLCLGDELSVLQGNRRYFTSSDQADFSCSHTQSPSSPDTITWTDQDGQDINSQATLDANLSSLFTAVYSLNFSDSYTSVTCQVDDKSHTFYQISLEAENVTGVAGKQKELTTTCSINLHEFSPENEKSLYFIEVLNGSEVYYTAENISSRHDKIVIDKEGSGTYRMTLFFLNTSVPADVQNKTEIWKCGVRDPINNLYTFAPFSVTLDKNCTPGTGMTSSNSSKCSYCPENTFSLNNHCQRCPEGEKSERGSTKCREVRDWGQSVYFVFAGVGAALLIIILLTVVAILCRRREGEGKDVVISNPNHRHSVKLSKTSV